MKINFKKLNFWIYTVTAIIIIVVFSYAGLFLYYNFYRTITQTDDVITLRKDVPIEYLDIKKFNQVIEKLEKKTKPADSQPIKNIF